MRNLLLIGALACAAFPAAAQSLPAAVSVQTKPSIASAGGGSFAVWQDLRSGGKYSRVYGSPVGADGRLSRPEGMLLGSAAPLLIDEIPIAVLPLGGRYVVIWNEQGNAVRARRVEADGTPADPVPATLLGSRSGITAMAAASNGTTIAVLTGSGVFLYDSSLQFVGVVTATSLPAIPLTASMASDGSDFVIAGRDKQGNLATTRFTAGGDIRNSSTAPFGGFDVARLLWTGSDYAAISRSQTIIAQRLDQTGVAFGPQIVITMLPSTFVEVDAAGDGNGGFAAIYNEQANLFAAFVPAGANSVQERQAVSISLSNESMPALAYDGAQYVAAWQVAMPGIARAVGIDSAAFAPGMPRAEPVSSEETVSLPWQLRPAASKSRARLVAWEEEDGSGIPRVMINAENGEPSAVYPSTLPQTAPAIDETDSGNALVVWFEPRADGNLLALRVDPNGHRLGEPVVVGTASSFPQKAAVLHVAGRYLVAFADTSARMRVARITDDGTLLDPGGRVVLQPRNQVSQLAPVFTTAAGVIFLLWQNGDGVLSPSSVGGVKLDAGGNSLDSASLFLDGGNEATRPDAASAGERFLVVWETGGGISGRVLGLDRQTPPFVIAPPSFGIATSAPSVTFDGAAFLVAWQETPLTDPPSAFGDIHAARVNLAGSVENLPVVASGGDAELPFAFTFAGSRPAIIYRRLADNVPRLTLQPFEGHPPPPRRRAARK
jgi:hypothetical protein